MRVWVKGQGGRSMSAREHTRAYVIICLIGTQTPLVMSPERWDHFASIQVGIWLLARRSGVRPHTPVAASSRLRTQYKSNINTVRTPIEYATIACGALYFYWFYFFIDLPSAFIGTEIFSQLLSLRVWTRRKGGGENKKLHNCSSKSHNPTRVTPCHHFSFFFSYNQIRVLFFLVPIRGVPHLVFGRQNR
jgi:hypothetical protein